MFFFGVWIDFFEFSECLFVYGVVFCLVCFEVFVFVVFRRGGGGGYRSVVGVVIYNNNWCCFEVCVRYLYFDVFCMFEKMFVKCVCMFVFFFGCFEIDVRFLKYFRYV